MKYLPQATPRQRVSVAVLMLGLALAVLTPRRAFAQNLYIDFTTSNSAPTTSSGTTAVTTTAGASTTVYVWAVVSDPGVADSTLGLQLAYFDAVPVAGTSGLAFSGGGVTQGSVSTDIMNNYINGPNITGFQNPWNTSGSHAGAPQAVNSTGITGVGNLESGSNGANTVSPSNTYYGTLTAQNGEGPITYSTPQAASNVISTGGNTYEFGNTAGDGGVAYGSGAGTSTGGWAWLVGTFQFTAGTATGISGGQTIFEPIVPEWNTTTPDQYTVSATGGRTSAPIPTSLGYGSAANSAYALGAVAGSSVTFQAQAGVGTVASLTLAPTSVPGGTNNTSTVLNFTNSSSSPTTGYLVGATIPTQTLSISNSGTSTGNYTLGTVPSWMSITDNNAGSVGASGTSTLTAGVTATTAGMYTGTFRINDTTSGNSGTDGNLQVSVNADIGNVSTANIDTTGGTGYTGGTRPTGTFGGMVMSSPNMTAGTYAGLSSNTGATPVNNPTGTVGANPGIEGTTATILLWNDTQTSSSPSMTWRARLSTEVPANDSSNNSVYGVSFPNGPSYTAGNSASNQRLLSDVVNLYGMGNGTNGAGTNQTQPTGFSLLNTTTVDPFVFQMSYNPETMFNEGATKADMATRGNLFLASLVNTGWENTILANVASPNGTYSTTSASYTHTGSPQPLNVGIYAAASMGGASTAFNTPYEGTFAAWEAGPALTAYNTATNSTLTSTTFETDLANGTIPIGDFLGAWGVDTTGYDAWAVVNHNSEFAVVPEPSTIVLAGFGLLGGFFALRRRKNSAAA